MEAPILSNIASAVLETLLSAAGRAASENAAKRFSSRRARKTLVEAYLRDVTNDVFYLITYRPAAQHINDAYVEPALIDGALSQTYIEPSDFEIIIQTVLSEVGRREDRPFPVPLHHLAGDPVTVSLKYLPISSIIERPESILVLGEAGSGKSALLAHVCWSRLRLANPRLPIYLSSRHVSDHTVSDHVVQTLEGLQLEDMSSRELDEILAFYIDGLDEVSPERYRSLVLEIGDLRKRYPSAPIVASCRSATYAGELGFLREVSIAPFNEAQSTDFVRRWFSAVDVGPTAQDFLDAVKKSERLTELATQPLLLSLMCNAFRRYLNFSRRQTTLFEQCVMTLLWQWDAERTVRRGSAFDDLDLQKRLWLHAAIANHFHCRRGRYLSRQEMLGILAEILPRFGIDSCAADSILFELCSHHGLLVRWTEETYGFGHLALQEFLAAKWLSDAMRWTQLISEERLLDLWWRNVLGLTLAALSDATEGLREIYAASYLTEIARLQLIAHCLRYDPIVAPGVRDRLVRRILDWYHNGDTDHHDAAVWMLLGIEDQWTGKRIQGSLARSHLPSREESLRDLRGARD